MTDAAGFAKGFDRARYMRRRVLGQTALFLSSVATVIGLAFLAAILFTLVSDGLSAWHATLLTRDTPPPGDSIGGLRNAIMGTLLMTATGVVIGAPVGILAGTYIAEFSRGRWLGQTIQFVNDLLLSAPSIIVGLFVYQVVVVPMQHFSAFAGSLALAILVVPIVTRTTVDMLGLVPNALREAAAALGTARWRVVMAICYRAAAQGILTGVLLAVARISGETAPLLFTALNNNFFSTDMNGPISNLPVVIFQFALSPYENWQHLAWGGALLIAAAILLLNIIARSLAGLRQLR